MKPSVRYGVDEYLYSGNWCFIEWAENIPNLIPDPFHYYLKELPEASVY
jgi:tRNA threonylcarbamoyladenosine biosynthesis protein TsaE